MSIISYKVDWDWYCYIGKGYESDKLRGAVGYILSAISNKA